MVVVGAFPTDPIDPADPRFVTTAGVIHAAAGRGAGPMRSVSGRAPRVTGGVVPL
jgi:hypothetical protein